MHLVLVAMAVGLTLMGTLGRAQKNGKLAEAIKDADMTVIDFAELIYPDLGRAETRPEGPVVVRASLDDKGRVVDEQAVFGNEILARESLANIRKWRFLPNAAKSVVVVYNFRIVKGRCRAPSSFFTLQKPNLATITGCFPASATNGAATPQDFAKVTISDSDVEVLDFEEMRYPRLAAEARIDGVVVVQVKLTEQGEVEESTALSGKEILIKDCLTNVRKWRFRPNPKGTAIVVYIFRFPCGNLSSKSDYQEQFVLDAPNLATVTGTAMHIQTQS
jgi:TonB family protein